jgi:hypothetical protein
LVEQCGRGFKRRWFGRNGNRHRVERRECFDFLALMLTDYERPTAVMGNGAGLALLTAQDISLKYVGTWSAFSGPGIAAHIHGAANPDEIGDILVNLPVAVQPNDHGVLNGVIRAEDIQSVHGRAAISLDSLISLVRTGNAYLDVHTAAHPDGEIRGNFLGQFSGITRAFK